jgi:hypothetical protein
MLKVEEIVNLTGAESLCNPYASADELIKLIKEYEPRERKAVKWDE